MNAPRTMAECTTCGFVQPADARAACRRCGRPIGDDSLPSLDFAETPASSAAPRASVRPSSSAPARPSASASARPAALPSTDVGSSPLLLKAPPTKPSPAAGIAKFVGVILLGLVGMRVLTFVTDMTKGIDRTGRTLADGDLCMLHMPDGWNRETHRIENAWLPWLRPGPEVGFEVETLPGFFERPLTETEFRAGVAEARRLDSTLSLGTVEDTTVMDRRVFAWEFEQTKDGRVALHRAVVFDFGAVRRKLEVWICRARTEVDAAMLREVTASIHCREPRRRR